MHARRAEAERVRLEEAERVRLAAVRFLASVPRADAQRELNVIMSQAIAAVPTVMQLLAENANDLFLHVLEALDDQTLYEIVPLVCKQWRHADLTPRLLVHLVIGMTDRCSPFCLTPQRIHRGASRAWRLPVIVLPRLSAPHLEDERDAERRTIFSWLHSRLPSFQQLLASSRDLLEERTCSKADLLELRRPLQAGLRWLDICAYRGGQQATEFLALAGGLADSSLAELRLELDAPIALGTVCLSEASLAPFMHVTSLDLRLGVHNTDTAYNDAHSWDWLVALLPRFTTLQTLRWDCRAWRDGWVRPLMQSLARLSELQSLTLVMHFDYNLGFDELEPLRAHAKLRHLALDGIEDVDEDGASLLQLLATLPSLESLFLPNSNWSDPPEFKAMLANFLSRGNIRSLGVVRDAYTRMYWPYAGPNRNGADFDRATRESQFRDSQQPWADDHLGGCVWSALSEAEDSPDASTLYDKCCCDELPQPNTSLWRLLSIPTVPSPFDYHNVSRPYALEHLLVEVSSPSFSYLADLARACAHSFPLLKTLHIEMSGCELPNVAICAALWWLAKPPPTPAGTMRLQHLTLCIGPESAQGAARAQDKVDEHDQGFCPYQLQRAFERYFGRGGKCTCTTKVCLYDGSDYDYEHRHRELLEAGVRDGCCDARCTRYESDSAMSRLPWRWW